MTTLFTVGKETLSFCGKCKLKLSHTIMALNHQGQPAKVMCKTCRSTHSYKNETLATVRKTISSPAKPRATQTSEKLADIWQAHLNKLSKAAIPYNIKNDFKIDDVIDHPSFGIGYISKYIANDKVEVIFRTEIKTLIHKK